MHQICGALDFAAAGCELAIWNGASRIPLCIEANTPALICCIVCSITEHVNSRVHVLLTQSRLQLLLLAMLYLALW